MQVAHAAGLVSEVEIRNLLSYLRAQLADLIFWLRRLEAPVRRPHDTHRRSRERGGAPDYVTSSRLQPGSV